MSSKVKYVKDSTMYDHKPTHEEAGGIKLRLGNPKNQKEGAVEELAQDSISYSIAPVEIHPDAKGALSKRSFRSQQIFMADIDNEIEGIIAGRMKKVKAPAEVYVDLDELLSICLDNNVMPAFIYFSASHTAEHCKMRAVFITDKPIYDVKQLKQFRDELNRRLMKNGHHVSDQKCLEESRIYFPGQRLCYENYDAVVNVDSIIPALDADAVVDEELTDTVISSKDADNDRNNYRYNYISNCSYDNSPSPPEPSEVQVINDQDEYYEAIARLPMDTILEEKDGRAFRCYFHDDKHPSAHIRLDPETGRWWYRCFGCGYRGDLFKVLRDHLGMNFFETVDHFKDNNGIILDTSYQHEARSIIDIYIDYLTRFRDDEGLQARHPALYKRLRWHISKLIGVLEVAKTRIPPRALIGEADVVFTASLRYLMSRLTRQGITGCNSIDSFCRYINQFVLLGLLGKVPEDELGELRDKIKSVCPEQSTRHVTAYRIPKDSPPILLRRADTKAQSLKDKGFKAAAMCRDSILSASGADTAGSVYTQDVGRGQTRSYKSFKEKFTAAALRHLDRHGYIYEAGLREEMTSVCSKQSKTRVEAYCDKCIPEFLKERWLQRLHVNKTTRRLHQVDSAVKSNSCIIARNPIDELGIAILNFSPPSIIEIHAPVSDLSMESGYRLYKK